MSTNEVTSLSLRELDGEIAFFLYSWEWFLNSKTQTIFLLPPKNEKWDMYNLSAKQLSSVSYSCIHFYKKDEYCYDLGRIQADSGLSCPFGVPRFSTNANCFREALKKFKQLFPNLIESYFLNLEWIFKQNSLQNDLDEVLYKWMLHCPELNHGCQSMILTIEDKYTL